MKLALQVVGFMTLISSPVQSQEFQFSPDATKTCLASGTAFELCVGASAAACVEANGYATVVDTACYSLEADWWDAQLNTIYPQVMEQAREMDQVNGQYAPSQAEALREMQRAWIAFRDATCRFEASQWGGGTGAGPAFSACRMRITADQVRYLEGAGLN